MQRRRKNSYNIKMAVFWDVAPCGLAEVYWHFSTSETWINCYQVTWHNISEDIYLHNHHCENLKSQLQYPFFCKMMCPKNHIQSKHRIFHLYSSYHIIKCKVPILIIGNDTQLNYCFCW
jgi:hypothetical protein